MLKVHLEKNQILIEGAINVVIKEINLYILKRSILGYRSDHRSAGWIKINRGNLLDLRQLMTMWLEILWRRWKSRVKVLWRMIRGLLIRDHLNLEMGKRCCKRVICIRVWPICRSRKCGLKVQLL